MKHTSLFSLATAGACCIALTAAPPRGISQAAQNAAAIEQSSHQPLPTLVKSQGNLVQYASQNLLVRFAIYATEDAREPIWNEQQRVDFGPRGEYSVLLGSASTSGLPPELFAAGEPRWLAVAVGDVEATRILLTTVPYAMKAADANTLGGLAVSSFVTQDQLAALSAQNGHSGSQAGGALPDTGGTVTGSGTTNTVPLWTSSSAIGNSVITQSGKSIGIGIATPASTLDVDGGVTVRGDLNLPAPAKATASKGEPSNLFEFSSSAWNSSSSAAQGETFFMVADPTGNDTASPSATLNFQFKNGSAAPATVFSVAGNGIMTFSPAQTFPGTIGSVTGTSPITAATTSGAVTVGLNAPALETMLNSVYPQLSAATNSFTGILSANTAAGSAYAAVEGAGINGSAGVSGNSDSGYGAEGSSATGAGVYGSSSGSGSGGYFLNNTTSSPAVYAENDASGDPGLGIAVKGYASGNYAIGVLGKTVGNSSYGLFGENVGGTDSYGVYGSATALGSHGVYGIASGPQTVSQMAGSGVVGVSTWGSGTLGMTAGGSVTATGMMQSGFHAGAWGDSGAGYSYPGVFGTADAAIAGLFENNSSFSAATYSSNDGTGPAAQFLGSSDGYATINVYNQTTNTLTNTTSAGYFESTSSSNPTLTIVNDGSGGKDVSDGIFTSLIATTPAGTCGIGGAGDLSCTGQVKSLVSTGDGARRVETYAPQSAENWMEDYGTGDMKLGVALVKIDPAFAETISQTAGYHIFLTPKADSKGLYVINETATSFEVRESGGGTSSLSFDYKIVAKRRGYEAQRLQDVTDSFNTARARVEEAQKRRPNRPSPLKRPDSRVPPPAPSTALKAALEAPERAPLSPRRTAADPSVTKAAGAPPVHP